jgi:hypothetical protein
MKQKKEEISLQVLDTLSTQAEFQIILDSGAIPPSIDTLQKLQTIVQMGKELRMPPMTSITNIHIIKGRAVISSAILGALLKSRITRNGTVSPVEFDWVNDFFVEKDEDGDQRITTTIGFDYISEVTGKPKRQEHTVSWAQFETAGYTDKPNWAKYPKEMMRARCMASAVRALFPEILMGIYTDSEIVDSMNTGHETSMNEEGDIVIIKADSQEVD